MQSEEAKDEETMRDLMKKIASKVDKEEELSPRQVEVNERIRFREETTFQEVNESSLDAQPSTQPVSEAEQVMRTRGASTPQSRMRQEEAFLSNSEYNNSRISETVRGRGRYRQSKLRRLESDK